MEQKHELSPSSSSELSKEIKSQQVVDCLTRNLFPQDTKIEVMSYLTEDEVNKVHNNTAFTCTSALSLFKPNFKSNLLNKLFDCVTMGKQYDFYTQVIIQEPTENDKRDVMEKRKILFISKDNHFEIAYCRDNFEYIRTEIRNESLIKILTNYKEGQPIESSDRYRLEQILTKSGIRTHQDMAERLLKVSPELMIKKINFTCGPRIFSNISVFTFLLWALDTRYGVNMMLNCIPHNEKGLEIARLLQEQYDYHEKYGVTYTLEGRTITEKHFQFSILIDPLQVYVDEYYNRNWEKRENHWCKWVGMAQRYLPMHVMQHYFDPNVSFYPCPNFKATQFVRSSRAYNYINSTWQSQPYCIISSTRKILGLDFGICGKGGNCWGGEFQGIERNFASNDLGAIKALGERRESDYAAIPSKLAFLFKILASVNDSTDKHGIPSYKYAIL